MSYTLLQIVDQVSGEMGLTQPTAVIGSTVNQTLQLLALVQRLGRDLVREFEWEQLVRAYIFQTIVAQTKTSAANNAGLTTINVSAGSGTPAVGSVVSGVGIAPYTELVSITPAGPNFVIVLSMPTTTAIPNATPLTFATQDYPLPSDYDRMISDTNWDRTNHWRNLGSKSSQEWQTLQGGLISTGPRERFRIYGGKLRIFPALTTVYNMAFEYVCNSWVIASGGTTGSKPAYSVDSDLSVFPDDLMFSGLKYYFLKAKKLDFGVEMADFNDILSTRKTQDVPIASQSLAPTDIPMLIGPWSVQDGDWPTT